MSIYRHPGTTDPPPPAPRRLIPLWRRLAARARVRLGLLTTAPDRPLRPGEGARLLVRSLDETFVLLEDLTRAVRASQRRVGER